MGLGFLVYDEILAIGLSKEDVYVKIIVASLTLIDNRFMQQKNSLLQFGVGKVDEGVIARFSAEKRVDTTSWNNICALLAQLHNQGIDLLQDARFASHQLVQKFRDRYQFVATQHQVTSTRVDDPTPTPVPHTMNRGKARRQTNPHVVGR